MANIAVSKEAPRTVPSVWEPFRAMRNLMGWDPFREMIPSIPKLAEEFAPSFDVKETPESYVFRADVPGVKESDLAVTLTGNRLSISGKREAERKETTDTYYCYERSYGDFSRSFTLPEGVDSNAVHADLKDGVLTVSIRKNAQSQAKRIAIKSAAQKS
jgi:HSP20 family protein